MAKVTVIRQMVDDENQLSWVFLEIEETDLFEGEEPYMTPPAFNYPVV